MKDTHYKFPSQNILTQRGPVHIDDIIPGDCVYEYQTSNLLPILRVDNTACHRLYEIEYSDGRREICIDPKRIPSNGKAIMIPVHFDKGRIYAPLDPDPYVAGSLIVYGNQDTDYICMDAMPETVKDQLIHKYDIKMNEFGEFMMTWKGLFGKYDFYATTKDENDPLIPYEYLYETSLKNRIQFAMGIFDTGRAFNFSYGERDTVMMWHDDPKMLKEVQKVLWSIGLLNRVRYSPAINHYVLELIGRSKRFITGDAAYDPGLFYNITTIGKMIDSDVNLLKIGIVEEVLVRSVTEINNSRGLVYKHIVLEDPNAIYLSENFIPRYTI